MIFMFIIFLNDTQWSRKGVGIARMVRVAICRRRADGDVHWCRLGVDIGMLRLSLNICQGRLDINTTVVGGWSEVTGVG